MRPLRPLQSAPGASRHGLDVLDGALREVHANAKACYEEVPNEPHDEYPTGFLEESQGFQSFSLALTSTRNRRFSPPFCRF